jgi:membrane fusion protein, multidrug efflux system
MLHNNRTMTQPVMCTACRGFFLAFTVATGLGIALMSTGCGGKEGGVAHAAAVATSQAGTPLASRPSVDAVGGKWVPAVREALCQATPAVGTFRARQTTRLSPQISGRVESVLVDAGDVVKKGQLVVRLEPAFFDLEVGQAKAMVDAASAAVAVAEIDLKEADREMRRQRSLREREAAAPKEQDDAMAMYSRSVVGLEAKKAMLAEAGKRLQYAQERLKETRILIPYDAVVTRRLVDPGEYVCSMPPTHLLEVQEVGVLYLEFSLPQELLSKVAVGTAVEYVVEGVKDSKGTGQVAMIFPAIDELTRSFRCRVVVESKDLKLRPGLLARVRVAQSTVKDAIVVPRVALSQSASGWQVQVSNDGHPVPRPVKIGLVADDKAQIVSGLQAGERVLVSEVTGLREGDRRDSQSE